MAPKEAVPPGTTAVQLAVLKYRKKPGLSSQVASRAAAGDVAVIGSASAIAYRSV